MPAENREPFFKPHEWKALAVFRPREWRGWLSTEPLFSKTVAGLLIAVAADCNLTQVAD
jgi:hypothetical protein